MIRRLLLASMMPALILSACTPGELVSSDPTAMTVTARKSYSRRFWVSLREDSSGAVFDRIRFSGKRCSHGPSRLPVGKHVTVLVNSYREADTGRIIRRIDRSDLDRQFC